MEHQHLARTSQSNHRRQPLVTSAQPTHSPEHPLRHLQRTIGNRAVGRLIQAKLRVSQPGDISEQEADRVAEQVLRMPDSGVAENAPELDETLAPRIQRLCSECDKEVQRESLVEEEKEDSDVKGNEMTRSDARPGEELPGVRCDRARAADGNLPESKSNWQQDEGLRSEIDKLSGGGESLPESERSFFEPPVRG